MSTALSELRQLNVQKQREAKENDAKDRENTDSPLKEDSSTVAYTTSSMVDNTTDEDSDSIPAPVAASEQPSRTTKKKASDATSSIVGSATTLPTTHTTTLPVVLPTASLDPLKAALLSVLAQPVPPAPEGGKPAPATVVTSIKVRTEIWERLGHAAQLTGKNKQDLIAEALVDIYAKIVREQGGTA